MLRLNKRAQSTLEYALIVAVVVGALLAMQIYVKRGLQGRLRSSTDNIGDQYSAGRTQVTYVTEDTTAGKTLDKTGYDDVGGKGISNSTVVTSAVTKRTNEGGGPDVRQEHVLDDLKDETLYNPDMDTNRLFTNDR